MQIFRNFKKKNLQGEIRHYCLRSYIWFSFSDTKTKSGQSFRKRLNKHKHNFLVLSKTFDVNEDKFITNYIFS